MKPPGDSSSLWRPFYFKMSVSVPFSFVWIVIDDSWLVIGDMKICENCLGTTGKGEMIKMSKIWLTIVITVFALSVGAYAAPVTLNFYGEQLHVDGEFIGTVPVSTPVYAPLFQNGQTIQLAITYDPSQSGTPGPFPNQELYSSGSLSVVIPELGLSASRSSTSAEISVALDVEPPPSPASDQLFYDGFGVDTFVNTASIPTPVDFWAIIFGTSAMFTSTQLPTGPLNWDFGNVSFFFASPDPEIHQVLLTFSPAPVPEPATMLLLGSGLLGLWGFRKKFKK